MTRPSVTNRAFVPTDGSLENDPTVYLPKVFIYFLQNLFRDFPEGAGMKWDPDEKTTELIITAEKPTCAAIEKLPHITVVLGTGRMQGVGMDQMQLLSFNQGWRQHTDLMPMTVAYHCQAKNGVVARRIAWNAGYYTNVLRRIIMRVGKIFHVSPSWDMSAESPATAFTGPLSNTELVSVVDTIPFYWQPSWRITEPAHIWRNLHAELHVHEISPFYRARDRNKLRVPNVQGRPVVTRPMDQRRTVFTQIVLEGTPGEEE